MISVVIATRDRPELLARTVASLRGQADELIVVDDGSAVPVALDGVRVIRHPVSRGPAAARNTGWRAASGELIAFTDDDCVADPGWVAAGAAAWDGSDACIVQGRVVPEREPGPFERSLAVDGVTAETETANVFYPRALLLRLGGFDESFAGPQGEDTDLGWRARSAGARVVFAPGARVEHAVFPSSPGDLLRRAWRWTPVVQAFAAHPELRRERLWFGLFWNWTHYLLVRALLALPLLRRRWGWPLAGWLAGRLVRYELQKGRGSGSPAWAVYWLVHDAVETAAIVRGAVRHRVPVI